MSFKFFQSLMVILWAWFIPWRAPILLMSVKALLVQRGHYWMFCSFKTGVLIIYSYWPSLFFSCMIWTRPGLFRTGAVKTVSRWEDGPSARSWNAQSCWFPRKVSSWQSCPAMVLVVSSAVSSAELSGQPLCLEMMSRWGGLVVMP